MFKDLTYKYNTRLSPKDEWLYQLWKAANRQGFNDEIDYDMRGAWLEGNRGDSNMHFPDIYKKPNHPTFSTSSKYYGIDAVMSTNHLNEHKPTYGGIWYNNMFFPTEDNLDNMRASYGIYPNDSEKYISGIDDTAVIVNPHYKGHTSNGRK